MKVVALCPELTPTIVARSADAVRHATREGALGRGHPLLQLAATQHACGAVQPTPRPRRHNMILYLLLL